MSTTRNMSIEKGGDEVTNRRSTIEKRPSIGSLEDINERSDSVFQFKNVSYTVGKGDKKKKILNGISATLRAGETLAIMGPSGAGKSTLLNALTLSAVGGVATGSVTLNNLPLTERTFHEDCFIVQQQDFDWPFLTCRETLLYAAELYVGRGDHSDKVDDIIAKLGLDICKNTRVGNEFFQGLSGGQRRRLSVAIGLLKKPKVLFLDEPTSGLDAASAAAVMQELKDLAQVENLIIVTTIHQPSTKVYNNFDQVMILSRGREAYTGKASEAPHYFESIGYEMERNTNPAEFFLDLVNADFTSADEVNIILDKWNEHINDEEVEEGNKDRTEDKNKNPRRPSFYSESKASILTEVNVMFRRHGKLVIRDPMLYIGRALIFLFANMFFAFTYWESRERDQSQALNYMFVNIWFIGVPTNMGVIAVFALNSEYKTIRKEIKNGLVRPISYIFAKTILVIPIMFLFGIFAYSISGYVIQKFDPSTFGILITIYAISYYSWECMAEAFSVVNADPLLGMMNYTSMWFAAFLFCGLFLPEEDMVWPLKAFFYVLPLRYSIPAIFYNLVIDDDWESCDPDKNQNQPVCVNTVDTDEKSGALVLDSLGDVYPLFKSEDETGKYLGILLAIAVVFKIMYIGTVYYLTSRGTTFKKETK